MNFTSFLNCINYNGLYTGTTGQVVAIYDLASGSGNSIFYNQIYPSGYHFSGGNFYGPAIPLISVGSTGISSYVFSGLSSYRMGYTNSGDFGLILDINYNGCSRSSVGYGNVLVSNAESPTGMSGNFCLGINDSNRLFFSTNDYSRTLPYELRSNNLIYLGLGDRNNIEFGVFDIPSQSLVSEQVTLPSNQNLVNKLYIGGFLNYSGADYSGFFGSIYNAVLFDRPLDISGAASCSNCLFTTGYTNGAPSVSTVYFSTITGYLISGNHQGIITGFINTTGIVFKADGSSVNLLFPSGLTGLSQIETITTLLTGVSGILVTGDSPIIFLNDRVKLNGFLNYNISFDYSLVSGDTLEVYTFPNYNQFSSLSVDGFAYPVSNYPIQIIGNGLIETNGVDYIVDRTLLSGFYPDDILMYDLLTGSSLISPFSGAWIGSRIAMSGGVYFPPTGQFLEQSGRIFISGISGMQIPLNGDVYMNGQKLISGFHYNYVDDGTGHLFGGVTGLNILNLYATGLPSFFATPLYSPTGGLPTGIGDIEDSELTVIPSYGSYNRFYLDVTNNMTTYSGISGFSEQVWVNGVRQKQFDDYTKDYACSQVAGIIDPPNVPFVFFNNQTGYFNIN